METNEMRRVGSPELTRKIFDALLIAPGIKEATRDELWRLAFNEGLIVGHEEFRRFAEVQERLMAYFPKGAQ